MWDAKLYSYSCHCLCMVGVKLDLKNTELAHPGHMPSLYLASTFPVISSGEPTDKSPVFLLIADHAQI